jgi:hypothetical protein
VRHSHRGPLFTPPHYQALVVLLYWQSVFRALCGASQRELRRWWATIDLTVEEGLNRLTCLCTMTLAYPAEGTNVQQIPTPSQESTDLLEAAGIKLPSVLAGRSLSVVTKKRLAQRRNNR